MSEDDEIFRGDLYIHADASVPGGIAAVWKMLGANLVSEEDMKDDLNLLRLMVVQLLPTGEGRWNLALAKNIDAADGRVVLLEYSLNYGRRGVRQVANLMIKDAAFPEDQVRANELHEIQIDLHTALIDCDVRNCRLPDSLRADVATIANRLVRRALRNEVSVSLVRRRAAQLLKLVVPKPTPA